MRNICLCGSTLPKISAIHHVRFNSRNIRWGTNIEFENGVILKFTGRLDAARATTEATGYYRGMVDGGWTEGEIVTAFGGPNAA